MRRRINIRSMWAPLIIVGMFIIVLVKPISDEYNARAEEETNPIIYNIDVTTAFANPENEASSELTVSKYKTTKSDKKEKIVKEVDEYNSSGSLQKRVIYERLPELQKGIIGSDGASGYKVYSVAADKTETLVQSVDFSYTKKNITRIETWSDEESENPDSIIENTYTENGLLGTSQTFYYSYGEKRLYSVENYKYEDGVKTSSTYSSQAGSYSTKYVYNTNGSVIKSVSVNDDGDVISREQYGYYDTGKLAFYKIYGSSKDLKYKNYYYYNSNGYLIMEIDYAAGADEPYIECIKTYKYFD